MNPLNETSLAVLNDTIALLNEQVDVAIGSDQFVDELKSKLFQSKPEDTNYPELSHLFQNTTFNPLGLPIQYFVHEETEESRSQTLDDGGGRKNIKVERHENNWNFGFLLFHCAVVRLHRLERVDNADGISGNLKSISLASLVISYRRRKVETIFVRFLLHWSILILFIYATTKAFSTSILSSSHSRRRAGKVTRWKKKKSAGIDIENHSKTFNVVVYII